MESQINCGSHGTKGGKILKKIGGEKKENLGNVSRRLKCCACAEIEMKIAEAAES